MEYTHPEYLITPEQLNNQMSDNENLRIFDAAVFLTPKPAGGYEVDSGYDKFVEAHIPGAGFIDLVQDWADTTSDLNFTLPTADALAAAIGATGINTDHQVVLYSSGHLMWATRAWWLLHYAGHNNVAILNGNIAAWKAAGYDLDNGSHSYPTTEFTASAVPNRFADTGEVATGMHGKVCTVNALSRSLYEGTGDFYYTRRGHIPGSQLLYFDAILDQEHFLPAASLAEKLENLPNGGMLSADQVITYCGGGIAATLNAFACKLLGQDNVAVYDGSMSEWVQDESRPLTVGVNP